LNSSIISKKDFTWDLGVNATFQKNEVSGLSAPILTGALHGQGMSGTLAQIIQNGQPLNTFYTRDYKGIDKSTGQSIYTDEGNIFYFVGNPNPTTILGINTSVSYKKLSFSANMNGSFGHKIYNNTLNSVLPIGNLGTRNISADLFKNGESITNPITASSRYLEKGNYLKMANATLSYNFGSIGKEISALSIYITGQNLFVITKYKGFDPEVNVDKQANGVPSFGIDYIGYPSARTFLFGINVSF
jgi:TonB-dependent starch-binding outer membrane protein SusC